MKRLPPAEISEGLRATLFNFPVKARPGLFPVEADGDFLPFNPGPTERLDDSLG
jgi:hypothetical protein